MEIFLDRKSNTELTVFCDGQYSHAFILPDVTQPTAKLGAALYQALFPQNTISHITWSKRPDRILLVSGNSEIDNLPWEQLQGPDGLIVLQTDFVRGVVPALRQTTPALGQVPVPVHIFAIPANPLGEGIDQLDVAGEWRRLITSLASVKANLTLERVYPPTLKQTQRQATQELGCVIHFMGHGGHDHKNAYLIFENEEGASQHVTAGDLIPFLKERAFLISLNACSSAAYGETEFSNLARSLVEQGIPYALGMRLPIPDEAAKDFSQEFYTSLAGGLTIENALTQARKALAQYPDLDLPGIPVLYTSLTAAIPAFAIKNGEPQVLESVPTIDLSKVPQMEGVFQGRISELLALGKLLVSGKPGSLITIVGPGGQGKSALARAAAERFAYAWPGGVYAFAFEAGQNFDEFLTDLARFLKLNQPAVNQYSGERGELQPVSRFPVVSSDLQNRILSRLSRQPVLLLLDNAELLLDALEAGLIEFIEFEPFLRKLSENTSTGLLVTSRRPLSWPNEEIMELSGLAPEEGARLFWQWAPNRSREARGPQREVISRQVSGHPFSLRLLGGAFNLTTLSLDAFTQQIEQALIEAEEKYATENQPFRTLFASLETSLTTLPEVHKQVLEQIALFEDAFLPETAVKIFVASDSEKEPQPQAAFKAALDWLYRRGWLNRLLNPFAGEYQLMYRLHPIIRIFLQKQSRQSNLVFTFLPRLDQEFYELLARIKDQFYLIDWPGFVFVRMVIDLEASALRQSEDKASSYNFWLGWIQVRLGARYTGLRWLERALELTQEVDRQLEADILNNIALLHMATGQPTRALAIYDNLLPLVREHRTKSDAATVLGNMAELHRGLGHPEIAMELFQQAQRELPENEAGIEKAALLMNMGALYRDMGNFNIAQDLTSQALALVRQRQDKYSEAMVINNLALIHSNQGQFETAVLLLEQALQLSRGLGDRPGEAANLGNLGDALLGMGQPIKALEYFNQALPILLEVENRVGVGIILQNQANAYFELGHLDKALELFNRSMEIALETGSRVNQVIAIAGIGEIFRRLNQFDQALEYFNQALPIAREIKDHIQEAGLLNKIGLVYSVIGKPEQALTLIAEAARLQQQFGDRAGQVKSLSNLAYQHERVRKIDQAWALLKQALVVCQETHYSRGEASILIQMGEFSYRHAKYNQALEYFENAVKICQTNSLQQLQAIALNDIGMIHYRLDAFPKALDVFQRSLVIVRELDDHNTEFTVLNNHALVYRALRQPAMALEYYQQARKTAQKMKDQAAEAIVLVNLAELLYAKLSRPADAIEYCELAITYWQQLGNQDHPSGITVATLQTLRARMRAGKPLRTPWQNLLHTLAGILQPRARKH